MSRSLKLMKVTALGTALALAMSVGAYATQTDVTSKTITGTGSLDNPTYSIILPSAVAIVNNPLEMNGNPGLYSAPIAIANKSSVPVLVTAEIQLTNGTGVTQKFSVGEVNAFDSSVAAKDYFIAAKPVANTTPTVATKATADSNTFIIASNTWILDPNGKGLSDNNYVIPTKTAYVAGSQSLASMQFKLANTAATTTAFTTTNVGLHTAGFMFEGTVNPFAAWKDADITAKVTFRLAGLSGAISDLYDDAAPASLTSDALNLIAYNHATDAVPNTGTVFADLPHYTGAAIEVKHTAGIDTGLAATSLNITKGTGWTVDAVTLYNIKTGVRTEADGYTLATGDITLVNPTATDPLNFSIVAAKLLNGNTAGAKLGDYYLANGSITAAEVGAAAEGSYKLAMVLKNTTLGIETTVFVPITISSN